MDGTTRISLLKARRIDSKPSRCVHGGSKRKIGDSGIESGENETVGEAACILVRF